MEYILYPLLSERILLMQLGTSFVFLLNNSHCWIPRLCKTKLQNSLSNQASSSPNCKGFYSQWPHHLNLLEAFKSSHLSSLLPFLLLLPSSLPHTSEIHFPRLSPPLSHTLWLLCSLQMYVSLSYPLPTGKIKLFQMILIHFISCPKHHPKLSDWHIVSSQSRGPKVVCIQQVEIPIHFLPTTKKLISSLCQPSKEHISPKLKNLTTS